MTELKPNDLSIAFISFVEGTGGKRRPVLIQKSNKTFISVLSLTSQYTNKSEYIKKQYYKIKDWQDAGLMKPTWIDIQHIVNLPKENVKSEAIGKLSNLDIEGLANFIKSYKLN